MKWLDHHILLLTLRVGIRGIHVCKIYKYNSILNPYNYCVYLKCTLNFVGNILDGLRPAETAIDDEFIRRFILGTWHDLIASEIIIKRQHNIIRIAAITVQKISVTKMYFLIGYTEELLSYWLQCPIKLELQTVEDRTAVVFKYI